MKAAALIYLITLTAGLSTSPGQDTNLSVSIASGWNFLANPLSTGTTNGANEIMSPFDGEVIVTWDGARVSYVTYDSGFAGWVDVSDNPSVPPSLPPGKGFALFNPGPMTTLTFTGRMLPAPGTTNSISLPSGYSLLGSLLPATVTNITSAPVSLPIIDGMQILTWTGTGYDYSSYDSGFGGWIGSDFSPKPAPAYTVGQGFFFYNPGPPSTWEQFAP